MLRYAAQSIGRGPCKFSALATSSMVESAAAGLLEASKREAMMLLMQESVRTLIAGIGEDLEREGLRDTPKRVAKAFMEMSIGYHQDVSSTLNNAIFHEEEVCTSGTGIVLVRDIDFAALSEDTLMPFYGRCHVAYLPSQGAVLGLSKLARITKLFAKRLQTQEQLGQQVLQCMQQQLAPLGVAVVLQARHLGFGGADVSHLTAAVTGVFAAEPSCQLQELLLLLGLEEQPPVTTRVAQQCTCPASKGQPGAAADSSKPGGAPPAVHLCASGRAGDRGCGLSGLPLECGVLAPATPDPSEGGEEAPVAEVELAEVELEAAGEAAAGGRSAAASVMEAAVQVLLREVGEDPQRPALQAAVKRYVSHLLAATAGYQQQQQQQRRRPRPLDSAVDSSSGHSKTSTAVAAEAEAAARTGAVCRESGAAAREAVREAAGEAAGEAAAASLALGSLQDANISSISINGSAGQHGLLCPGAASRPAAPAAAAAPAADGVYHFSSTFASQCEHHMLPFQGSVHIAYVLPPGAAPLPVVQLQQLVAMYTRRLQLQERITHQLLHGVAQLACATGVMVVVEAAHMCMVARGVENHAGSTTSCATLGAFSHSSQMRAAVIRRVRQQLAARQARAQLLQGLCTGVEEAW